MVSKRLISWKAGSLRQGKLVQDETKLWTPRFLLTGSQAHRIIVSQEKARGAFGFEHELRIILHPAWDGRKPGGRDLLRHERGRVIGALVETSCTSLMNSQSVGQSACGGVTVINEMDTRHRNSRLCSVPSPVTRRIRVVSVVIVVITLSHLPSSSLPARAVYPR